MPRCIVLIRSHEPLQEGWRKRSFKPHAGDSDPVIEQGTGGPERALAPSLLQRFVAADQYDATWHRRLSSLSKEVSISTGVTGGTGGTPAGTPSRRLIRPPDW